MTLRQILRKHVTGPDHNNEVLHARMENLETIMARHRLRWAGKPCWNARHSPIKINPLLGAHLWQEASCSTTSSIQGSGENHHAEERNRPGQLGHGSCRKYQLENNTRKKKQQKLTPSFENIRR